jgi:sec-independent protein translocase protein TatA
MGGVSIWHWIVVGVIVMLLFGRGKVSELMGDVAKGIKSFKKGMAEDEPVAPAPSASTADPKIIDHAQAANAATAKAETKA